jgi:hypothetical protein
MSKEVPLPIAFYRTPGSTEPVREWLMSLQKTPAAEIDLARRRQKEVTSS